MDDITAATPAEEKRITVTYDVTDPDDRHVLTQALDDYAVKQMDLAADGDSPEKRTGWALRARVFRDRADEAAG